MDSPEADIFVRVQAYTGEAKMPTALGSGAEALVYATSAGTAIKVMREREKYINELAVYRRLREHDVVRVMGLNVPQLLGWSDELLIIEMTIVTAPFLLDFAQARLDEPLSWEEGGEEEWWQRVSEAFGERFEAAAAVYCALVAQFGIYYYDLAPRNVRWED